MVCAWPWSLCYQKIHGATHPQMSGISTWYLHWRQEWQIRGGWCQSSSSLFQTSTCLNSHFPHTCQTSSRCQLTDSQCPKGQRSETWRQKRWSLSHSCPCWSWSSSCLLSSFSLCWTSTPSSLCTSPVQQLWKTVMQPWKGQHSRLLAGLTLQLACRIRRSADPSG